MPAGGVVAALLLVCPPAWGRAKTDLVDLENGDRVTGEIKQLDRGKLSYKTDSMSTLSIEWDDVLTVQSQAQFRVELEDGTLHYGALEPGAADRLVRVVQDGFAVELELAQIVRIVPIEATFWKRVDGSLDAGLNYTQSSDVSTYSFDAGTSYRTRKFLHQTSLDVTSVRQESGTTTTADLTFYSQRLYRNRWFTFSLGSLQRDDELGVDLRVLAGGGGGRYLVQTNRNELQVVGGAVVNQEQVAGRSSNETNAELLAGLAYSLFRYDYPETSLDVALLVFPSATESGRVRSQLDIDLTREIVKDFYWKLSLYDNYDSEPPSIDAKKNDWGTVISLGWTF